MGFKTTELLLASAVADDGAVTGIAYPSGTNQAFFTGGNAASTGVAIINNNDVYEQAASDIGITYGASTITLTNTSDVTWPAGASVTLQLGYASLAEVSVIAQPAIAALGGTLTGTNDGSLSDLPTITDTPATADALRDDLVTNVVPVVNANFKELQAKVNGLIAALVAAGVLDAS